ncbi:2,3-bisphosphoglycerate-dependent phosphoglycerate mutase, partial [Bifidobacterium catenulatum]
MTYKLVLLRHGQSAWNKTNQFTGWVDVPLTEQGVEEAKNGGRLLKEKNVLPDIVFTSMLRRAINTANVALDEADRLWIPVQRSWRLNERHYGALQGKNKTEIRQEYGDEKFML